MVRFPLPSLPIISEGKTNFLLITLTELSCHQINYFRTTGHSCSTTSKYVVKLLLFNFFLKPVLILIVYITLACNIMKLFL